MLPETRPLLGRRLTLHLSQSIGNIHPTKGRSLFDIAPRCLTLHTPQLRISVRYTRKPFLKPSPQEGLKHVQLSLGGLSTAGPVSGQQSPET
jgi:hypothetical protein